MKEPAIDLPDVLERVQDDQELLLELLDIFQEDFINKRKNLDELVRQADATGVRDLIHSMKGAAGNISAKPLFNICLRLEKNADQGNLSTAAQDLTLLDQHFIELKEHIALIKANPKKYLPR